jgi:hypothetical protein
MAEVTCGASIQCCAIRVAVLEQDGVPLPGAANMYVTDAIAKFEATPVYTKGVDMEVLNACGLPAVLYKARDVFKRYDITMDLLYIDPELEAILIGNVSGSTGGVLTFSQGGFTIGASGPDVGLIGAPYGVSCELWSKHIVNGDLDVTWPYVQWIVPRSYWQPDKVTLDNNAMPRSYAGFTTENPNYFNGPMNDWTFDSGRSLAYRFTKTIPSPSCGAQALVHS